METKVERFGQVVVLDPPNADDHLPDVSDVKEHASPVMVVLPSISFPRDQKLFKKEVAYLAPMLAFNLGTHISCLNILVNRGREDLGSLFSSKVKVDDLETGSSMDDAFVGLELEACFSLPKYASHLRVSFVKIPRCGTLETLKGKSLIEAEDRQEAIDSALQDYFTVDRFMGRGDVFSVHVNWNCKSENCISCSFRAKNPRFDDVYFKVYCLLFRKVLFLNCVSFRPEIIL